MKTKYIDSVTGKKFSGKWANVAQAFNKYAASKGYTKSVQGSFGWANESGEIMTLHDVK